MKKITSILTIIITLVAICVGNVIEASAEQNSSLPEGVICQVIPYHTGYSAPISLRNNPSDSAAVVANIPVGGITDIISTNGYGWGQAKWNGYSGWVYLHDTQIVGSYDVSAPSSGYCSPTYCVVYNTDGEGLEFRTGPGTIYSTFGPMYDGSRVIVLATSGEWCFIYYDGKNGWAHQAYLRINGDASNDMALGYRPLGENMSGSDVAELQNKLNSLGYSITVDGSYGNMCTEAVRKFQQDMGLNSTGVADFETIRILINGKEEAATSASQAAPEPDTASVQEAESSPEAQAQTANNNLTEAYMSYIDMIDSMKDLIDSYDSIYTEGKSNSTALCDITMDSIPELFFMFFDENDGRITTKLYICSWSDGTFRPLVWKELNGDYCLYKRNSEDCLYISDNTGAGDNNEEITCYEILSNGTLDEKNVPTSEDIKSNIAEVIMYSKAIYGTDQSYMAACPLLAMSSDEILAYMQSVIDNGGIDDGSIAKPVNYTPESVNQETSMPEENATVVEKAAEAVMNPMYNDYKQITARAVNAGVCGGITLVDITQNGTPELLLSYVLGSDGKSNFCKMYTYDNGSLQEVPMNNTSDVEFTLYRNKEDDSFKVEGKYESASDNGQSQIIIGQVTIENNIYRFSSDYEMGCTDSQKKEYYYKVNDAAVSQDEYNNSFEKRNAGYEESELKTASDRTLTADNLSEAFDEVVNIYEN